jgi:hypothetical protein
MFRVKHSPIIRSSIKLYLQHLVLTNRVWPAIVVDESELVGTFLELIHVARNDEHKIFRPSTVHLFKEYRAVLPHVGCPKIACTQLYPFSTGTPIYLRIAAKGT